MKKLLLIVSLLLTSSVFAQVVNTNWVYNSNVCRAKTVCPDGRVIWCQAVGFNYGNAPRVPNNLCRSRVVPGSFVHCQGFSDQVDNFGRLVFVPVNLPVSCF